MAFENALHSKDKALVASIVWVFLEFWGYSTRPRVNTATWRQAKYYVQVIPSIHPLNPFSFPVPLLFVPIHEQTHRMVFTFL